MGNTAPNLKNAKSNVANKKRMQVGQNHKQYACCPSGKPMPTIIKLTSTERVSEEESLGGNKHLIG